jgi:hypothetical protein
MKRGKNWKVRKNQGKIFVKCRKIQENSLESVGKVRKS